MNSRYFIKMPLTKFPWVKKPLLANAPMAISAGPALAVAVSQARGLGFIGPAMDGNITEQNLSTAAKAIRESESLSSLLPSGHPTLPVGVGFLLWKDELQTALSAIASHKPCAVWLYAPRNGQQELDEWTQGIREASPATQVWIQIGTMAEARSIVESAHRPDIVVVQGAEAGGHGRAKDGMGLMTLLPEVADVLAGHDIPLIAAGGIADGRGVAAAICLGANGVVMGTRFLASTEACISKGYQDAVVQATEGAVSTTRTLLYNHLRGTYGWPEPFSPRTVTNRSWEDHVAGVPFDELKKLHDEAQAKGHAGWGPEGRLATYAGAGVGLVGEVLDAGVIVERVRNDAAQRVRWAQDVV